MDVLGENVRQARSYRSLSQRELASKSGISRSSLSLIENNGIDIRLGTVKRLAEALDMSLAQLFSRTFLHENIMTYTEDDFLFVFSQNAKALIKKQRKFQSSLYSSAELSSSTISEIFNKKVDPRLSSLEKIAIALDTDISQLITRGEG